MRVRTQQEKRTMLAWFRGLAMPKCSACSCLARKVWRTGQGFGRGHSWISRSRKRRSCASGDERASGEGQQGLNCTPQRWEHFDLPVRRPQGKSRNSVIALTEEFDVWLRATPVRSLDELSRLRQRIVELESEIVTLRAALDQERRTTVKLTTKSIYRKSSGKRASHC